MGLLPSSLGILSALTAWETRAASAPRPNPLPLCVQEKKQRRAENLKRRLENERKAEIVQVVSVALLAGRDAARLNVVFQTPRHPCFTAPARAAVPGPPRWLPFPQGAGRGLQPR